MKKNGKLKAVIGLIVILAALVGLLFTAIVGVGAEKSGAASNIRLGLDLAGGVSITYQAVGEEKPSDEDMDDTVYKLQRRVESYSTEALVYREGDDRINIEIPGVTDANSILEELGRPGSLYFIRETDEEGNPNYSMNASTWSYELTKDLSQIIADGDAVLS
ncbi:MAG: protein translocase subunit SecDF, partial [Lachnospiraceae bacterium]|nr:protein translocase subunit SecDF [Lachnospiraceae bacterium]